MAATLDDFAKKICKDRLERRKFVDCFQRFLTKVDLPDGWEDSSGYELHDGLPTYTYRHNCLRKFVEQTKAESMTIDQLGDFIKKLENAAHSPLEIEKSFSSIQEQKNQPFDLFEQNIKIKGVVVRKCDKKLKASILTKKQDRGKQKFSLNELVINIQDASKSGEGFQFKVGDVVEVTKCRRKEGIAFDAQLIKCFSHTESEMQSFLEHLVHCLQSEGSTATVTELTRCQASWDYILEKCDVKMAPQILDITDKICSSAQKQMSHTVKRIVKGLERSVFFKSVLPSFIHSMTKEDKNRVQRVLEHVMRVSPESGPKLLPMAIDLAHSLVCNSSDEETAAEDLHTGCHSAIEFLAKLLSIIATEVPGAREDLKALQWRELPLIPVTTELHEAMLKTDDLPKIKTEGNYQSEEVYLDTHFRLLREECFYKLRKGISGFVANRSQFDSKDMMMYRIVLKEVSTRRKRSPTVMSIALTYTVLRSKTDTEEWDLSSWFLYGDLLCISIDNSFQEPIWATVEEHDADKGIVWIILCGDGANDINETQFIMKMQEVTERNEQAFMAESKTFYTAFASAMDVLKHKDCVPFKEFLVDPETNADNMKPADYINEIKQRPDWGIIFKKEQLPDRSNPEDESYSLLEEFDQIRLNGHCKAELDDTQLKAVELALKKKLALIQGPPGTGKSFVGVALVRLLLSMNVPRDHGPILVITYKNFALDHFLEDCLKKVSSRDVKIVRVGRLAEGASEKLEKCLLRKVGGRWPDRRFEQKRTLTGKLWAMQFQVSEASRKLRESSIFNSETFLNEASRDQIKYLLVNNKRETVDGAEVETVLDKQDHGRLKELVEKVLKDWLPAQEEFDSFAREENRPPKESGRAKLDTKDTAAKSQKSSAKSEKQKTKEDQEQENPNDLRDPAMEQRERLLAVDEELPDDEDKEIMKNEDTAPQERRETIDELHTRKLVSIDETRVKRFRNLLNASKVWDLDPEERIQLAYVFQSSRREKASEEFLAVSQVYMQVHQELKELRNQHDIEVMRTCDVIGMTVTGATMRANLLADIKPSVMIVEEAAEILEGQLVAVIPPSVQHLIMIGDHKQLKPAVHFHRLKKHHHLDLSMFERLVNCKLPYRQLEFQCRMRDEFVDLLRRLEIYKELKTNEERVRRNDPPQCVEKSMYFWTHTEWESDSKNSHSKLNVEEAKEITKVAEAFCREGQVLPSRITVLCSYRGQVTEIKNRFLRSEVTALRNISVATIDSFQGQENDVILISLVRSSRGGKIGYLSSPNRLCVAISRARCGLYLFGNHAQLSKASKRDWKKVTDAMREKGCLGHRFPFRSSSQFKSQGKSDDQMEGRSPGREPETMVVQNLTVINASQANVIIAGDNSRNTITTTPANSVSGTRPRPDLEMQFPRSEKIPVHDPKSPTLPEGWPPQCMEEGGGSVGASPSVVGGQVAGRKGYGPDVERVVEATKEARMPTQETPEAEKSLDSSEIEKAKERPVQESENPKNSITGTTVTDEEVMADKEARQPTQETPEAEKSSPDLSEIEKADERPVQESENPKNSITDTAVTEEEIMADKEARQPTQETPEAEKPPDSSEIEKAKERPVQESENPKNSITDTTVTDEEIMADKEARQPTQETPKAAEKSSLDSSEIEKAEERPVQESENPKNSITDTAVPDELIIAGYEDAIELIEEEHFVFASLACSLRKAKTPEAEKRSPDLSEIEKPKERPVQESENPKNSITDTTVTDKEIMADKEARQPTQDTPKAAENSSLDSSEIEKAEERPVQESENPKNSITDTTVTDEEIMADKEARQSTQETLKAAEKSSLDSSEIEKVEERLVQESENPKNSITDTAVTDEEIMADKEARQPTRETPEAEKSSLDSSEIEKAKERPVQESENPKNSIPHTTVTDEEIMAVDVRVILSATMKFEAEHEECVRVLPYLNNGDVEIHLYVYRDRSGIPTKLKNAAQAFFGQKGWKLIWADLYNDAFNLLQVTSIKYPSGEPKRLEASQVDEIEEIIDKHLHVFSNHRNVTAVQPSFKVTKSVQTEEACIVVYVLGKGQIPMGESAIPCAIGPYPVDIVNGFCVRTKDPYMPTEAHKQKEFLRLGASIGVNGKQSSGTLGAIVEDKNSGTLYALSCDHVMNNADESEIIHPGLDVYLNCLRFNLNGYKNWIERITGFALELPQISNDSLEETELQKMFVELKTVKEMHIDPKGCSNSVKEQITIFERNLEEAFGKRPRVIASYSAGVRCNVGSKMNNGREHFIDAAISELNEDEVNNVKTEKFLHIIDTTHYPSGTCISATINATMDVEEVFKSGSATGFTESKLILGISQILPTFITDFRPNGDSAWIDVDCINCKKRGTAQSPRQELSGLCEQCRPYRWLKRCLCIQQHGRKPFSDKGDSGAVIFKKLKKENGNEYQLPSPGFGIIFAELPSQHANFAIASPLEIALEELSQKVSELRPDNEPCQLRLASSFR